MTDRIRVRGRPLEPPQRFEDERLEFEEDDGLKIELKHAVDVNPTGRGATEDVSFDLEDGDVIEYRDTDGWVEFTTARSVRERAMRSRAGSAAGAINLADVLAEGRTRGDTDLDEILAYGIELPDEVTKALEKLGEYVGGKLIDAAAREAAKVVVWWVEKPVKWEKTKRDDKPKEHGVYRLDAELRLRQQQLLTASGPIEKGGEPCLVLITGHCRTPRRPSPSSVAPTSGIGSCAASMPAGCSL